MINPMETRLYGFKYSFTMQKFNKYSALLETHAVAMYAYANKIVSVVKRFVIKFAADTADKNG